jgi:hypothetical protein
MLIHLDSSTRDLNAPEDLTISFCAPIELTDKPYEVALIKATVWYSWFNIASYYNNNSFKYFNGTEWKDVEIPDGNYSLDELNKFIQRILIQNADDPDLICFIPNYSTLRLIISLKPSVQMNLKFGTLHEVLGYEKTIVTESSEGSKTVDITRGVNSILIHCSLISSSYNNGVTSDILYSFLPDKPPGNLLDISPNTPIYLPINEICQIKSIRMRITDQQNRPVRLNGEHATYLLHFRPVK